MVHVVWFDAVEKKSRLSGIGVEETGEDDKDDGGATGIVKLTKAERRAKLKKQKKETKKLGKELDKAEELQQTPQAAVLVLSHWCQYSAFTICYHRI